MKKSWMMGLAMVTGVVMTLSVFADDAEGVGVKKGPPEGKGNRGKAHFAASDTDGNGVLSLEEFTAAHVKREEMMKAKMGDKWDAEKAAKRPTAAAIFAKLDADGSGDLTPAEMKAGHEHRRKQAEQGKKGKDKKGADVEEPEADPAE